MGVSGTNPVGLGLLKLSMPFLNGNQMPNNHPQSKVELLSPLSSYNHNTMPKHEIVDL